jgi:antitoxin component of RelBE/YafQ-DinJ toxin-antitoxin module
MEVRDDIIKVRCNREEKQRFKDLAAAEGLDVSALVRRRVFAGAAEAPAPVPSLFDSPSGNAEAKVAVPAGADVSTTSGPAW